VRQGDAEQEFLRAAAATYEAMAVLEPDSLEGLLDAENDLPKAARETILQHALAGAAAARRMIATDPANGYLLLALHLGFQGVAKGKVQSFFEGMPTQIIDAYTQAIEIDETTRTAGPLQVKGRFRTVVPFPYRDVGAAIVALERARSIAPVKQTHFFLGDAYARRGRIEDARASWESARRAEPAPHAMTLAPLVDVLVDQRLRRTASPRR
jgi:tetratricopeptide (TPR) repeat protein